MRNPFPRSPESSGATGLKTDDDSAPTRKSGTRVRGNHAPTGSRPGKDSPAGDQTAVGEIDRRSEKPVAPVNETVTIDREELADLAQRERFTGLRPSTAIGGWLAAVGVMALGLSIVGSAGYSLAFTALPAPVTGRPTESISIEGMVLVAAIALLGYLGGGYVAGRMVRFQGALQGIGVWAASMLVAAGVALATLIGGSDYNLLGHLNLPRIPVDEGDLTFRGGLTLAIVALGGFLFAVVGGKLGMRYHRQVDGAVEDLPHPPTRN